MFFHYGKGFIPEDDLKEMLETVKGSELCIFAVRETARGAREASILYGFFFKDGDGVYFDIMMPTKVGLRVYANADRAVSYYFDKLPNARSITLPALTEENVIEPGGLI